MQAPFALPSDRSSRMSTRLPQPADLLFALLRGETPPALISDADWDAVGIYALATGLGPLLAHTAVESLPLMLAARLRLAGRRTAGRNQTLLAALADMLAGCRAGGLSVIILKGAYLAPQVYRDLSLRGMSDVDVLLRPGDLRRFQVVLDQLGYAGTYTNPESGPGVVKHEWTYRFAADTESVTNPYLSTSESFQVEPHTSLSERWFGLQLDIGEDVWDRAVSWELGGHPALALDPVDTLLHVAVHVVFHLIMGKPVLVQLYDIRQLLEANPDLPFAALRERAIGQGASAHVLAALRLAQQAYAAPVPSHWLDALASDSPPSQRRQAEGLSLGDLWQLTQQAPLTTLSQRLRRGVYDRRLAVRWARDRQEVWRVWRSAILFYRTDTAGILRSHLPK